MALKRIALRNFVIVQELDLDLQEGFTVLTGETGAGKSILVDALQLVLGARADANSVREGASRCDLSAEFDAPANLRDWLDTAGFDQDGATLLLRRSIDTQGKSRAWINGNPATATQLREVADHLVDIHGQHAWAALTRPDQVRGLLDAFGRIQSQEISTHYQTWRNAVKQLADAQAAQTSLATERERLQWQIGELAKLAPLANEWDALNEEHATLANAQGLLEAAHQTLELIENEQKGIKSQLSKAQNLLQNQERVTQSFKGFQEILALNLVQIEDVAHSLHSFTRQTEPDPQQLSQLDERITLWMSLARRYKRTPAQLADLLSTWQQDLQRLDAAVDLDKLQTQEKTAYQTLLSQCQIVSKARKKAAPLLGNAITQAMQGLGMQGGKFEVKLSSTTEPSTYGLENIEFLVAGHAGSTPKPVSKVASGGELSRIALAIAVTTSQLGRVGTLIFDEVDSGVGGAVAQTVGKLMKQLGKDRQVLAVTHLPQVASCADHHLLVSKQLVGKHTLSQVNPVKGETRVAEIARMLGGEKLSGTTKAHAKEMLGQ